MAEQNNFPMLYVSKGLNLTPEQHKGRKRKERKENSQYINCYHQKKEKNQPHRHCNRGREQKKKGKNLKRLPFSIELFQEMTCKLFFSSFLV
jgi:hypothetical protein